MRPARSSGGTSKSPLHSHQSTSQHKQGHTRQDLQPIPTTPRRRSAPAANLKKASGAQQRWHAHNPTSSPPIHVAGRTAGHTQDHRTHMMGYAKRLLRDYGKLIQHPQQTHTHPNHPHATPISHSQRPQPPTNERLCQVAKDCPPTSLTSLPTVSTPTTSTRQLDITKISRKLGEPFRIAQSPTPHAHD